MVWCTGVDEMVFSGSMHLRQLNSAKKKVSYVSQSIPCHTPLPYSHTSFSYVPRPLCVLQGPIRVKYSPVCTLWQQDGASDSLSNELVRSGHGARRFTVLFVFLGKGVCDSRSRCALRLMELCLWKCWLVVGSADAVRLLTACS